ncbi:MAG: NUDIX hydrolase [Candidatus Moraniibacteriota bacterium]|nr:MAG: NUDIX hydrolase [Candidatus Moranbacteria bacterium]
MEELVDIITIGGEYLQTVPKSQAHKDGLLHKTVIAELINSRGEFCFVRQAGDKQDAGQFVSPVGGHASTGEADEEALVRECQEECGITPTNYKLIGKTIYNREIIGRKENHFFVIYEIYTNQDPVLNHESIEYRWITKAEIKSTLQSRPETFGAAWHHVFKTFYPSIYSAQ